MCLTNEVIDQIINFRHQISVKNKAMIVRHTKEGKKIINEIKTKFNYDLNDCDIFVLVHEFAHVISEKSNPKIIPHEYNFLCEVFSFLMEKQLELWLPKEFESTIKARRNNRIFYESKMLKAIEYELQCEKIYQENGIVSKSILEESKINLVMRYDYDLNEGLVNYLLRYPLANLLSEYLIHDYSKIKDSEICQICLNTNLYEILEKEKMTLIKNYNIC